MLTYHQGTHAPNGLRYEHLAPQSCRHSNTTALRLQVYVTALDGLPLFTSDAEFDPRISGGPPLMRQLETHCVLQAVAEA